MGKWLDRVAPEMKAAEMAQLQPTTFSTSTSPDIHDIRHTPICRPCGRPQHAPDVVCPAPTTYDIRYPVAPGYAGIESEQWDEALADAWIAVTLERIGRLHDELPAGCPVDGPEWDRLEAVVNAAYLTKSRQGLRDALEQYEQHARATFEVWARREARP